MTILMFAVAAVILAVVVVVVVGSRLPRRHTTSRVARFRSAPGPLYALIAGPQTWRPDVRQFEDVSAGGRQLQRETTGDGAITYELLDCVPPRSLKRRIATEGLPFSGTWSVSLEESGGGTLVRITEDGEVTNPVFRFVSRFVLGHTRTIDGYLQALAHAVGETGDITITN